MRLKLAPLLSTSLILAACGGGDSAIDGARNMPNRFGNTINALDDFNTGSTGDSSNAVGLETNQVRVTMEVPVTFAPNGEATRRNLRIVIPDRVQVYRTNNSLQKLDDINYTTSSGEDGHVIITFENGLPVGPDVLIEATWNGGGGITMKALAADSDRDVKVNPFSHYVVEETLGNYSASEFQTVMNCVNDSGGGLCLNKYVWATLADQVHDFEIEIGSNAKLNTALTFLEARADFAAYIDDLADYALLDGDSAGSISASSADYNSVFFGLELGQTFRDDGTANAGQWGVRTAQEEDLSDSSGKAFLYPALTLTSFNAFGLSVTSLATDIPYDRQTIAHTADDRFVTKAWARNTHTSSPGAATLTPVSSVEGSARLLAGRALYQSITDQSTAQINGWTRNPYYLDAFTTEPLDTQTGPDRVLASYFTAGKAIELENEGGQLKRRATLENHYLSAFELHLLRSENFDLNKAQGDYNVVYLSGQFGQTDPVVFETGAGTLSAGSLSDNELLANANTDTFTLRRAADGSVTAPPAIPDTQTLRIANRLSLLSNGSRYMGRLSLCITCPETDFTTPDVGQGAASPDGSLLAFSLDGQLGDGLMIAGKAPTASLPEGGQYRVQGVVVSMTDNTNELYQVNNGLLQLTSGTEATLGATGFQISHTVTESQVSSPKRTTFSESFTYAAVDGTVTLTGSGVELQGFYTGEADQMFLVLEDSSATNPRTGLLMATLIPNDPNANP